MRRRAAAAAALAVTALALLAPAGAHAHAILEDTVPQRGAIVQDAPSEVRFRFNEPVESSFGAVRVYDASGERVDSGDVLRPDGRSDTVGVALRSVLPEGSYTATYRVVSADAHPVSGGFVFSIGRPGPVAEVGDLLDATSAGPVTDAAFGVARALAYAAIALVVGGALFLLLVWRRAFAGVSGGAPEWNAAASAFAARFRRFWIAAVALGVLTTIAGILLQGAEAGATSFWTALDPDVIGDVLSTRFGTAWVFRLPAYAVLAALLLIPSPLPRAAVGVGAVALGYLVLSPVLAGHASTQDPRLLLVPSDLVHVTAMSAWVGGVAAFALVAPAATRELESGDRTRLLAALVSGFSTLALVAVGALMASGITQSIVHLSSFGDFVDTPFGRALLVKIGLFLGLLSLGAYNRQRLRPRLQRIATGGEPPGRDGLMLRRTLRSELGLMAGVLTATAFLTSYAPPAATAGGPFSTTAELGPARMELTLDPARVGRNELHLYFFDSRTGSPVRPRQAVDAAHDAPREGHRPAPAAPAQGRPGPLRGPAGRHLAVRRLAPARRAACFGVRPVPGRARAGGRRLAAGRLRSRMPESELVQMLRDGYAAYNRGDYDVILDLIDENVEWVPPPSSPEPEPLHGRQAALDFMRPDLFSEQHAEPKEIIEEGDRILVAAHVRARGSGSGVEIDDTVFHLWFLKDGRVVRFEVHTERDEALAAFRRG